MNKRQKHFLVYRPAPVIGLLLFSFAGTLLMIGVGFYFVRHSLHDRAVALVMIAFGLFCAINMAYSLICYLLFFSSEIVFDSSGIHRILLKKERQFIPWDRVAIIYMRQYHVIPKYDLIVFSSKRLGMTSKQIFKWRLYLGLMRYPDVYFWMTYSKEKEAILKEYANDRIQYVVNRDSCVP